MIKKKYNFSHSLIFSEGQRSSLNIQLNVNNTNKETIIMMNHILSPTKRKKTKTIQIHKAKENGKII
jgi:hypothetical protein